MSKKFIFHGQTTFIDNPKDTVIQNFQNTGMASPSVLHVPDNERNTTLKPQQADKIFNNINISPQYLYQLRILLQNCTPINTNERFRAVFIDSRISLWRNQLPQATDIETRVNLAIDFLWNRYDDNEQNALVLLLHVLAGGIPDGDSCKQRLLKLAQELENDLQQVCGVGSAIKHHGTSR